MQNCNDVLVLLNWQLIKANFYTIKMTGILMVIKQCCKM